MDVLTVANAAAIINVAAIFVQLTYPLLLTVLCVAVLDKTTNAATWSVFGRLAHTSLWCVVFQSDTVNGRKVDTKVRVLSFAGAGFALLLAVAAAITPLGLRSTMRVRQSIDTVFIYVPDDSAIGRATLSRDGYSNNRVCWFKSQFSSCPGNDDKIINTGTNAFNAEVIPSVGNPDAFVTTSIAGNLTEAFTQDNPTIAGPLDIQYRNFFNYNNKTRPEGTNQTQWLDAGKPRSLSLFRRIQSFVLKDRVEAVEGLIVSTEPDQPGIGFRNHTLPAATPLGSTWTEQILWLEPETACVDLNITFDYAISNPSDYNPFLASSITYETAVITDRGGLVDNDPDRFPPMDLNDTQNEPRLRERAALAAYYTNLFLSKYLNVTRNNATLGRQYTAVSSLGDFESFKSFYKPVPETISASSFGDASTVTMRWRPSLPSPLDGMYAPGNYSLDDGTSESFTIDSSLGANGGDKISIKQAGHSGGILMGVGILMDNKSQPISNPQFQVTPGSRWSHPIYSCLTQIKASVKTVHFSLNETQSISEMKIDVQPTAYQSEEDYPTWAIEDTNANNSQYTPFWGVLPSSTTDLRGLATIKKADFYLPAGFATIFPDTNLNSLDAVAGLVAPWQMLAQIQSIGAPDTSSVYSGRTDFSLVQKWRELTRSAATAGRVKDLIWTDLMANAVIGTNNMLARGGAKKKQAAAPVDLYVRGLTYDWRYAVPALILIAVYLLLAAASAIMMCTNKVSIGMLRFLLNQTSAGRSMTVERYRATNSVDSAATRAWVRVRGDEVVRLGKEAFKQELSDSQGYYEALSFQEPSGKIGNQISHSETQALS